MDGIVAAKLSLAAFSVHSVNTNDIRRGPHSPCMCRNRCRYRWISGNWARTHLSHTRVGCPLSGTVGRWFLPDPAPELPTVLLAYRCHNSTFWGGPWMRATTWSDGWTPSTERVPPQVKPCACLPGLGFGGRRAEAGHLWNSETMNTTSRFKCWLVMKRGISPSWNSWYRLPVYPPVLNTTPGTLWWTSHFGGFCCVIFWFLREDWSAGMLRNVTSCTVSMQLFSHLRV